MTVSPISPQPKKASTIKRVLKLLLKITITIVCFWYISGKINFSAALDATAAVSPLPLAGALFLFLLSKWISAIRLQVYFKDLTLELSAGENIRLYLLGMFYNLFLPGAISGDAYKVILLNRERALPVKQGSAAVLLDRGSGVLALGLLLCLYGMFVLPIVELKWLGLAGSVASLFIFRWMLKKFFPHFSRSFTTTLLLGLAVQACQVAAIYCLMAGMGIPLHQHGWVFIFLLSAVITTLPISLGGGLGTRELVFLEGAKWLSLPEASGISISLLFYAITVAGSLPGLLYVFKNPLDKKTGLPSKP